MNENLWLINTLPPNAERKENHLQLYNRKNKYHLIDSKNIQKNTKNSFKNLN